jgi:hypothetical protein
MSSQTTVFDEPVSDADFRGLTQIFLYYENECFSGEKDMDYKHTAVTERIIKAFYMVYNTLGYGFAEKVYRNAMSLNCAD